MISLLLATCAALTVLAWDGLSTHPQGVWLVLAMYLANFVGGLLRGDAIREEDT